MLSAEHNKHMFVVSDECTICNTAGTELHSLLMGSITMFLSDFK